MDGSDNVNKKVIDPSQNIIVSEQNLDSSSPIEKVKKICKDVIQSAKSIFSPKHDFTAKLEMDTQLVQEFNKLKKEKREIKIEENVFIDQEKQIEHQKLNLINQALLQMGRLADLKEQLKNCQDTKQKSVLEQTINRIENAASVLTTLEGTLIGKEYANATFNTLSQLFKILSEIDLQSLDPDQKKIISELAKKEKMEFSDLVIFKGGHEAAVQKLLNVIDEAIKLKGDHQNLLKEWFVEREAQVKKQLRFNSEELNLNILNSRKSEPEKLVISYRNEKTKSSEFIKVHSFLKGKSYEEILDVYKGILNNINSYELDQPSKTGGNKVQLLKDINDLFFDELSDRIWKEKKVEDYQSIRSIESAFRKHISQAEASLQKKQLIKNEKIDKLNKLRKSDPQKELKRLRENPRIKKSLDKLMQIRDKPQNQDENSLQYFLNDMGKDYEKYEIVYAHSLELREALKEEFYVFNHAQGMISMSSNILAAELKKIYEKEQYQSEVFRHNVYIEGISKERNVDWYKDLLSKGIMNDRDLEMKNELISGSVFLESIDSGESALELFATNADMEKDTRNKVVNKMLEYYFPNQETREKFLTKFNELAAKIISSNNSNLYSICIPKDKFKETCYFSIPYGKPSKTEITKEMLKKIQGGEESVIDAGKDVQIRILSNALKPEKGMIVVRNSTLNESDIQKFKEDVHDLIIEARTQFFFDK